MQYKMYEGTCEECGKKIFLNHPKLKGFCCKVCETNYKWRKGHFAATQTNHSWTPEKTKGKE